MSLSASRRAALIREFRRRIGEEPDLFNTLFDRAVAALAEGELAFPAPFDLATSAALADNTGKYGGEAAIALFHFLREYAHVRYQVVLEAVVDDPKPGAAPMRREIVNCEVPAAMVAGLLIDVIDQLKR
jgi:hypothetical protein